MQGKLDTALRDFIDDYEAELWHRVGENQSYPLKKAQKEAREAAWKKHGPDITETVSGGGTGND